MRLLVVAALVAATSLSACVSFGSQPQRQYAPAPIAPYPAGPVAGQSLPPPSAYPAPAYPGATYPGAGYPAAGMPATTPDGTLPATAGTPAVPGQPAPVQTAAIPPDQGTEVRKTDLVGGWTLAAGGETCQLSMNLTAWTGGYRASTRGCASDDLKSIGAWDLDGKTILLKDASGSVVARLYASTATRYSGQTEVGKRGVQFFRG